MADHPCQVLARQLRSALADHDARKQVPYSGPDHFTTENDRVEALRIVADDLLLAIGLWPENVRAISNDHCLRLLDSVVST